MIDFSKIDIIKTLNGNVSKIQDKDGQIIWERFDGYVRGTTDGSNFTSSLGDVSYKFVDSILAFKLKYTGDTLTTLQDTFKGNKVITSIDHWGIKTDNVTNFEGTFKDCTKLKSINFNNWNTSSATSLRGMFNNCSSLTKLNLSSFDTSNATSLINLFKDCSNLTTLDLSNFNLKGINKVTDIGTDMLETFNSCKHLTTIKVTNCDDDTIYKIIERLKHDLSSYTWRLSNGIITREDK